MPVNEQLLDESLLNALDVQAVSAGLLLAYLEDLRALQTQLQIEVLNTFFNQGRNLRDESSVRDLISRLAVKIDAVLDALAARFEADAEQVAVIEEERQRQVLWLLLGVTAAQGSAASALAAAAIAGVTIADAIHRLAEDLKYRVAGTIRRGVAQGATPSELASTLVHGGGVGEDAPILNPTMRGLGVLVLTQTKGVAESARGSVVENSLPALKQKITVGWQHLSVIDGRTSNICLRRAFKTWDVDRQPIGHALPFAQPPLHPHCRSVLRIADLSADAVPEFTFRQWAERVGTSRLRSVFGAGRTSLWQSGGISDEELLRGRSGISLEEFRQRAQNWKP